MDRRKTNRHGSADVAMYVLDVRDLAQRIWQRKFLVALLTLALAVPSVAYLLSRPKTFQATSSVLVENHELNIADVKDAVPGIEPDRMTIDTQVKVISSPGIIRQVIDRLGLTRDPHGKIIITKPLTSDTATAKQPAATQAADTAQDYNLRQNYAAHLKVAPVTGTRIIEITYIADDPKTAADIVNAHTQQYVDSEISTKRDQAEKLNSWLAEQVKVLKEEGQKKAAAAQKFREDSGMVEGRNSEELIYQEISSTAEQLMPVEARRLELQARLNGKGGAIAADGSQSQVLQTMKTQASAARQDMESMRSRYGVNHPAYREAQKKAQQADADIRTEIGSSRDSLKSELATVTNLEASLNKKLADLKTQADTLKTKQITLQSLELEADTTTKLLNSFLARYEQIASQIDFARADVRIVSLADVPLEPVGSKNKIIAVLVLFLSAALASVVALLLSLLDGGSNSAESIRKNLGLRVMGVLPKVRNPLEEVAGHKPSPYLEQLKRLYLQIAARPDAKTILVTSAQSGEGKTSLTLALASYIAVTHRTAIVVEVDSSSDGLSALGQDQSGAGLADVLAGQAELAKAIRRTAGGIHVLPLGTPNATRFDPVASPRFLPLLDNLKAQYDFVLLDCAPILASTDAEAMAAHADHVVMVVAYKKTKMKQLKRAAATLRRFARDVPSAILNKAPLASIE